MLKPLPAMALFAVTVAGTWSGQRGVPPDSLLLAAGTARSGKVPAPPACPAKFDDSLDSNGIAPEGAAPGVTLPKPLRIPEAEFSDMARKEINKKRLRPFYAASTIALVVDKDGNPRDVCVEHAAPFDLDRQAAKVVWQYRFEPATKDGRPVAMRLKVEISFAMR